MVDLTENKRTEDWEGCIVYMAQRGGFELRKVEASRGGYLMDRVYKWKCKIQMISFIIIFLVLEFFLCDIIFKVINYNVKIIYNFKIYDIIFLK